MKKKVITIALGVILIILGMYFGAMLSCQIEINKISEENRITLNEMNKYRKELGISENLRLSFLEKKNNRDNFVFNKPFKFYEESEALEDTQRQVSDFFYSSIMDSYYKNIEINDESKGVLKELLNISSEIDKKDIKKDLDNFKTDENKFIESIKLGQREISLSSRKNAWSNYLQMLDSKHALDKEVQGAFRKSLSILNS